MLLKRKVTSILISCIVFLGCNANSNTSITARDKTTEELLDELGAEGWKYESFGGPYSAIHHNSKTRAIMNKGDSAVPSLIARLANGRYEECVFAVFCLREMKAVEAKATITELQAENARRFPARDLTLEMQCKFYLEDVDNW